MEKKMYVIVRRDLAPIYKMVQGSHALVEFYKRYPKEFKNWNNEYLIFVEVPNYIKLLEMADTLDKYEVPFVANHEPDLGGQMTALCLSGDHDCWCIGLPLATL